MCEITITNKPFSIQKFFMHYQKLYLTAFNVPETTSRNNSASEHVLSVEMSFTKFGLDES